VITTLIEGFAMIMSIKKSATLMFLLSVSPMLSAADGASVFSMNVNWITPSSLVKELTSQLSKAHTWVAGHPKTTGLIVAVTVFILLALLHENSLHARIAQETEGSFRKGLEQGYNYAKAEFEEKAKHELRTAKIDSYYEGYIAAADKLNQVNEDQVVTCKASITPETGSETEQLVTELFELLKTEGLQECELRMKANDLEVVVSLQV
jgi:hypothetical protein